jgi:VanZ family protein
MALLRRQKLLIVLLLFYWLTLFVLTHIPLPQFVHQAHVSDKLLHVLAYMILVFLVWSAMGPGKKVLWRKATVWWVLLVVSLYGLADELLQGCVAGRSSDVADFAANLVGVVAGLTVLSIFTFWPASLVVTGAVIFGLTNCTRANLADIAPVTNTAFHLFSYAFFTGLWIRCMNRLLFLRAAEPKLVIVTLALPVGLLLVVKFGSLILGKGFGIQDVIVSSVGILTVTGAFFLMSRTTSP